MHTPRILLIGAAAAATLVLAACGGGSDANTDAPPVASDSVPDEASSSTFAMAKWMASLAAASPDAQQPLDATRFNPPTPDDSEPETVN